MPSIDPTELPSAEEWAAAQADTAARWARLQRQPPQNTQQPLDAAGRAAAAIAEGQRAAAAKSAEPAG